MRNPEMEGGLLKRGVLPKKRQTPNNKTLQSAQGSIDMSKLETAEFGEGDGSYKMGGFGTYHYGERSSYYYTPVITEYAEEELDLSSTQFWAGRLSPEAKSLWVLVSNQATGLNTIEQKKRIQNFVQRNLRAQKVAHELLQLRRKKDMNSADRVRKMTLEREAAKIATAFTRELRAE